MSGLCNSNWTKSLNASRPRRITGSDDAAVGGEEGLLVHRNRVRDAHAMEGGNGGVRGASQLRCWKTRDRIAATAGVVVRSMTIYARQ